MDANILAKLKYYYPLGTLFIIIILALENINKARDFKTDISPIRRKG